jgi:hypothetical protein
MKSVIAIHTARRVDQDDGQFVHDPDAARDFPDVRKMFIRRRTTRPAAALRLLPRLLACGSSALCLAPPLCPRLPPSRTFSLIPRPGDRW